MGLKPNRKFYLSFSFDFCMLSMGETRKNKYLGSFLKAVRFRFL